MGEDMKTQTRNINTTWQATLLALLCTLVMLMPDFAFASPNTPMGNVMCTVVAWFTGNTGKGLASLAISVVGIGALLGKVSWGMAMIVGIGVAILFGAAGIVNAMGAGASTSCVTS